MDPDLFCKLTEDLILEYNEEGLVLSAAGALDHFFEEEAGPVGKRLADIFEFYNFQSGERLTHLESYNLSVVVLHSSKGIITSEFKLKELNSRYFLQLHKLDSLERNIIEKCELENKKDLLAMLGKMSHDFNNLLGVVMGHAELANYLSKDEEARDSHIKKVLESSVKIKNILKQILVYRHHMDEKPTEKFDLKSVIDRSVLNVRGNTEEAVSIKVKHVEPVTVCTSVSKLMDAFTNVIQNAVYAIGIEGEVYVELIPEEKGFNKVIVKDNGVGMSQRTMDHIFEPFFSTYSRMKSAGVGLSIVKGIMDQIGGSVEVRSELNKGTEVILSIPVYEEKSEKGKVLLVDDEKMVLGVTGEMVESLGYKVVRCQDLKQGEKALSNELFDVLLIDHHLSDGSGLDLIRFARNNGIKTPAVLSCGHMHADDLDKENIDGFLMKPTSMKDIESMFNLVLSS